jgi:hypothetical protein
VIFRCDTCGRAISVSGPPKKDPAFPLAAWYTAICVTCQAGFCITVERVRDTTLTPEDVAARSNRNT